MLEVKRIVDEISNTSSRNKKEAILKSNSHNQLLREVFQFTYSPYIQTGISTKKIKKKVSIRGFNVIDNLMDYLKENNTGSDMDIASVQHYIRQQPEELQELYIQMATKNLKVGITGNTINKCCGCGIVMDINQTIVSKIESVMELSNDYWMSKEGKRYEFKDMSAEYLRNCIKLLKRTYTKEELRDSNLFIGLTQEYMLR